MKNTIITIVAVLVGIAGAGYLVDAVQTKREVDSLSDPNTKPLISETEARAEFMRGCDTGEFTNQTAYCVCMYDTIRQRVTINEFANDGLTLSEQQLQNKYDREINYCIDTTMRTNSL